MNTYYKVIASFLVLTSIVFTHCSAENFFQQTAPKENDNKMNPSNKRKTIKILSIDGGGIRGIVPALILKNLESRLKKKKIAECFDLMSGTSTGGIIALLLSVPNSTGKQKYSAKEVYDLYHSFGRKIFQQTQWSYIKTLNGWLDEKYSSDNLEALLKEYFGDIKLSQALTNILIPAYDISTNKSILLNSSQAKTHQQNQFYMRDVARATSAAPTYFKPAKIKDFTGQMHVFIDGGIVSNNPALDACIYALELFGKESELLILSLGTGSGYGLSRKDFYTGSQEIKGGLLHWAPEITSLLMYGSSDLVNTQLHTFLNTQIKTHYYRFQASIDPDHTQMDDISVENIEILIAYAQKIIYENDETLDHIVQLLEKE